MVHEQLKTDRSANCEKLFTTEPTQGKRFHRKTGVLTPKAPQYKGETLKIAMN